LDAFVANAFGTANTILLNDGDGTFTAGPESYGFGFSEDMALGDLDGDGDLDAFVANSGGANKVWLGDGDGTFTEVAEDYDFASSSGIALGDFDGDGDLDAYIANHSGTANTVWLNDGDGTFTFEGNTYGSSASADVSLGDLDGDGDLDAFVGNDTGQANSVWLGNQFPSDITIDSSTVDENQLSGALVGALSSTDPDVSDAHFYMLEAGAGDTDNASFMIDGAGNLKTSAFFDYETKSSYSIRVGTYDGAGGSYEKVLTININDLNESPNDIAIDNSFIDENSAVGTTVGTFSSSDPDAGDTHTYSLVAGAGDIDNASFTIDGAGNLKAAENFDFETKNTYSILVRSTDSGSAAMEEIFTINVNDLAENGIPTDISIDNNMIDENLAIGTTVGTFTSTDSDVGDVHSYSLVAGVGDTDNSLFTIDGSGNLQTAAVLNYDLQPDYSIRVRTDDGAGGTYDEVFTVSLNDMADTLHIQPTDMSEHASGTSFSVSASIYSVGTLAWGDTFSDTIEMAGDGNIGLSEDPHIGRSWSDKDGNIVYDLSSIDLSGFTPEAIVFEFHSHENLVGGTATVQLKDGANTLATITGTGSFGPWRGGIDYADFLASSRVITAEMSIPGGSGQWHSHGVYIDTGNLSPTDMSLSGDTVVENGPAGEIVGTLSSTDPDVGDTHSYSLVSGAGDTDNSSFTIDGSGVLRTAAGFDYEAQDTYSILVRSEDGNGGFYEESFAVNVDDVNDAPSDITIDNNSVDENQVTGTTVGTFSSTDPDVGDTHTYSLAAGVGDTDNASFTIDGAGNLKTASVFDHEAKNNYSIRVRSDDGNGGVHEETVNIAVNDIYEAPPVTDDNDNYVPTDNSGDGSFTDGPDVPGSTGPGSENTDAGGFDSGIDGLLPGIGTGAGVDGGDTGDNSGGSDGGIFDNIDPTGLPADGGQPAGAGDSGTDAPTSAEGGAEPGGKEQGPAENNDGTDAAEAGPAEGDAEAANDNAADGEAQDGDAGDADAAGGDGDAGEADAAEGNGDAGEAEAAEGDGDAGEAEAAEGDGEAGEADAAEGDGDGEAGDGEAEAAEADGDAGEAADAQAAEAAAEGEGPAGEAGEANAAKGNNPAADNSNRARNAEKAEQLLTENTEPGGEDNTLSPVNADINLNNNDSAETRAAYNSLSTLAGNMQNDFVQDALKVVTASVNISRSADNLLSIADRYQDVKSATVKTLITRFSSIILDAKNDVEAKNARMHNVVKLAISKRGRFDRLMQSQLASATEMNRLANEELLVNTEIMKTILKFMKENKDKLNEINQGADLDKLVTKARKQAQNKVREMTERNDQMAKDSFEASIRSLILSSKGTGKAGEQLQKLQQTVGAGN
ncbi:MAG: cadherin domain-containing protein, partial [Planctomycetota bacterium]